MYKVNPDGSIDCDTLEEALRIQRAILSQPDHVESETPPRVIPPRISRFRSKQAPSFFVSFSSKLQPYNGKVLDADTMKEILDTETTAGVGPKLRHARNALEKEGKDLDSILEPSRSEEGRPRWTVKLSSTLPSA